MTLERFSAPTRTWFGEAFASPTPAQTGAWEAVAQGENALVIAPTGSGKTLAAFLWALDGLFTAAEPAPKQRLRVVYVSPLKALAVDVDRNLRSPLTGIRNAAVRLGERLRDVGVGVRTGDTPADERRRLQTKPPDILITTPESLYLVLTSQMRDTLRHVETVIVDEVHAVAGTKRGAHLALTIERLDALLSKPAQRIGLSATVRPPEEVARFLGGTHPVRVVDTRTPKALDLRIEVPVEDMSDPGQPHATQPQATQPQVAEGAGGFGGASAPGTRRGRGQGAAPPTDKPVRAKATQHHAAERVGTRTDEDPGRDRSIWSAIHPRLVELIRQHHSTIIFANSRRLAERICARINEVAEETIARAHHGSVSKEQRLEIEEALKQGRLPCVVATSSLELGIDMGAVDLVIQIEAPTSVASGLQRIGRGGHHVGDVSRGVVFPKWRGDLVECAVVVQRMREGAIEELRYLRNPLDVLAQQIVAMVSMEDWTVDDLETVVRRAASFADLPRSALEATLDMLAGRYPSDAFAELRPRIVWDRADGRLSARPGAQKLAVTSGGTIPDRGLYGVYLASGENRRVGELDEEMVYESRPGETFVLGASTWRIEDITRDQVIVTPAPGQPGRMPFWRGDAPGRPIELGRALGAFVRRVGRERERALEDDGLDDFAVANLLAYLDEQREATGVLPDDTTLVLERFRDELGDWRLCVHSFFGARVHAPWAQAIEARVRERLGLEVQTMYTDDGIVVRLPEADEAPPAESVLFEPEEIEELVVSQVGSSALFAARFRECAARALLIPRRRPGQRTPLWQQRQRSADLLAVASTFPSFPVVLETYRECLQDVFDVAALKDLMAAVRRREVKVIEVETAMPSPFASSLQMGYVASFLYDGDAPLAERRAQALTLDRRLLAELLGTEELRELIDPAAIDALELELQRLVSERRVTGAEGLADMLRTLGDLTTDEAMARGATPAWLESLEASRRAIRVRVSGEQRWCAIEDASRFRDALGTALPVGLPEAFLAPVDDPLGDIVSRYARTHGPFRAADVAGRFGLGERIVEDKLRALGGRVVSLPHGEWCDSEVLRRLRRRSLAAMRAEVEPVPASALARFLPAWQGVGVGRPGSHAVAIDATYRTVEQLAGAFVPASALESLVLPLRVPGYQPVMLDELCASGAVVWAGRAALGHEDGWVTLVPAERASLLLPPPADDGLSGDALRLRDALAARGAMFFRQLADGDDRTTLDAIWDLVWAGWVTNDTLAPLRAFVSGGLRVRRGGSSRGRRRPPLPTRVGPPAGAGRWSIVGERSSSATERLHAAATQLLERHGVVVRGAVAAEGVQGGFAAVYQVLKAMEEAGRIRRGYFVDSLGGAQFALPGAVDRLRYVAADAEPPPALVLAAADPANPYGAAVPWPASPATHRPGRKAGALVVLAGGELALYVEKGGRTFLTFTEDDATLQAAVDALALAVRDGSLGTLAVERSDGEHVVDSPLGRALLAAGFAMTPRGLRLRY
jgi:ATP-dependent Lhr-like helicase